MQDIEKINKRKADAQIIQDFHNLIMKLTYSMRLVPIGEIEDFIQNFWIYIFQKKLKIPEKYQNNPSTYIAYLLRKEAYYLRKKVNEKKRKEINIEFLEV